MADRSEPRATDEAELAVVNPQITDAVEQAQTNALGDAPDVAMGSLAPTDEADEPTLPVSATVSPQITD